MTRGTQVIEQIPDAPQVKPGVTVVICCYSHSIYFPAALESVLSQTNRNFEIIIHNNGADEEYSKLIESSALKHGIRVISNYPNTYGQAFRYNVLPLIETKYLAKLHDDDVFRIEKIERSMEVIERTKKDYLVTNSPYIDESGLPWTDMNEAVNRKLFTGHETRGLLLADMLKTPGRVMHYSTLVIRTAVAQKTMLGDPFWPRIADQLFWSELLLDDQIQGIILPENLSEVRIHGANDRLYDKFEAEARRGQFLLLSLSEAELTRRVLKRASDDVLVDFLEYYAGVTKGLDPVHALVEAAINMEMQSYTLWGPRRLAIPLLFHSAYERDGIRAISVLNQLIGEDANSFMKRNYDYAAEGIFGMAGTAPKRSSTFRRLRRHPMQIIPYIYDRIVQNSSSA